MGHRASGGLFLAPLYLQASATHPQVSAPPCTQRISLARDQQRVPHRCPPRAEHISSSLRVLSTTSQHHQPQGTAPRCLFSWGSLFPVPSPPPLSAPGETSEAPRPRKGLVSLNRIPSCGESQHSSNARGSCRRQSPPWSEACQHRTLPPAWPWPSCSWSR